MVENISNCFFCAISEMQYVFWQYHRLVIFYIQPFRERLSEKVRATIRKGNVGSFEFAVFQ